MRQPRTGSTGSQGVIMLWSCPCRRLKEAVASWGQSTDRSRWNRTAKTRALLVGCPPFHCRASSSSASSSPRCRLRRSITSNPRPRG